MISINDLTDHGDRYEGIWRADSVEVTVSVDKPDIDADTEARLQQIRERLQETLNASLHYFAEHKERYNVEYIDDLADPQIILGKDTYSVMWWSDKGEAKGECVIGIEFHVNGQLPFDIMIGD